MRVPVTLLAAVGLFFVLAQAAAQSPITNPCPNAQPVPEQLKIPANLPPGEPVAFEKQVLAYFSSLKYRELGWCEDKWVRDTGPYINGAYIGVHPAVRIYYSPEVVEWLLGGRKGSIKDGAVIIKEQYSPPPAARFRDIPDSKLPNPNDWTFMIKHASASRDGWFWGEVWNSTSFPMNFTNSFQYPNAGYGLYCLRCHGSADKENTFATLNNIKDAPGWPLVYRVDDSWIQAPSSHGKGKSAAEPQLALEFPHHAQNAGLDAEVAHRPLQQIVPSGQIQSMPPEPLDNAVSKPTPPQFITSSQCLGCHSAYGKGPFGPSMSILPGGRAEPINVSPYGEWRWSPMGLAGRDPVFYSQLDSELAFLKNAGQQQQPVIDICTNCHGGMGKKSYAIEHPGENFKLDFVYERDPSQPGFRYGGLARDGISCLMCHHMEPPKDRSLSGFLETRINGNFDLSPPDQLYGPFKDNEITTYMMDSSLGIKPKYNDYIKSSQMCGSCHTIRLPVLDSSKAGKTSVEQATYVEWVNSDFRNEYAAPGPSARSCQDCHMPPGYKDSDSGIEVNQIHTRMANVQDSNYPAAEHLARPGDLNVRYRMDGYRRHEFLGANGFLLQMFQQTVNEDGNNLVLGVRTKDYMSGFTDDLSHAIDNVVEQMQHGAASLAISKFEVLNGKLIVEVTVTNLTGHRFPSGVGFRRLFLELKAYKDSRQFWASGQTNSQGQIVDDKNQVLPTESFQGGQYQPHFNQTHPITGPNQVQIYEELVQDANHQFTTSFIRRDFDVKDNRLLPRGWKQHGPAGVTMPEQFLEATWPQGDALKDPVYLKGEGQSIVRYEIPLPSGADLSNLNVQVSLFSQTLPPYFLADRYQTGTKATERLKFLADALGNLEGTDFAHWKLLVARATK